MNCLVNIVSIDQLVILEKRSVLVLYYGHGSDH
ncbi:MAG: hypothetical protein ACD_41C00004G0003 [uncultured bacterium]|nr:MAG: hypothetical protein ACD_41C00004G0003 [uncultured bacterium]